MKFASEIAQLINTHFSYQVDRITVLRGHTDSVCGVYLMRDATGRDFVVRIGQSAQHEQLTTTSVLLAWLRKHNYLAPQPLSTVTEQLVGVNETYAVQLVTYLPGTTIRRTPRELGLVAEAVAALHLLPLTSSPPIASWWNPPAVFTLTMANLNLGRRAVPNTYQWLIDQLLQVVQNLSTVQANAIIHGDCWYSNAIHISDKRAALIDWDCAGIGPAILDLGALLLTSHYDLTQPLTVKVLPEHIRAILASYQAVRRLRTEEKPYLAASIPFYLAFNLGRSLVELTDGKQIDLFLLQKYAARYQEVAAITDIAESCVND